MLRRTTDPEVSTVLRAMRAAGHLWAQRFKIDRLTGAIAILAEH